jgi:tetracycline 7-halogenase / FADH2 O2-dependent halogenase
VVSESHIYRQEIDLYMLNAALGYGVTYRDRTEVREVETGAGGVTLATAEGETFRARFLVDGSGHKSLIAGKHGLREQPTTLKTRSRSIFTHMARVKRYDDLLQESEKPGLSRQWYEGTLHHVFDGGWFWVIPFDNVEGSANPLCSVGLTLDVDKFPERGLSAEEEFREIVARFPSIAAHFEGAEAVRPWVSTGRLQYSSKSCVGERWFLLAHAFGFVDALYSRGLVSTFETIHALAPRLMAALDADDFSTDRFEHPEKLQHAMLEDHDRMVHNSYRAFSEYPLWNAWVRVWLANVLFGDLRLFRRCVKYLASQDKAVFESLDLDPLPGSCPHGTNPLQDLHDHGESLLNEVDAGHVTRREAAEGILHGLSQMPLPPIHEWGNPEARHLDFLPEKLARMIGWGMTEAPAPIQAMFDFDPSVLGLGGGVPGPAETPAEEAAEEALALAAV